MIRTQQARIPWTWVVLITTTTGVFSLVDSVSGPALTFTLKRFTNDPALITFIGAINIAFNFMVAPYTAWKSDRIWTRWGRRRPFLLAGWSVMALALVAAPLSPSLWVLTALVILWQFGMDFGYSGPWSPLFYEVVPMHQRGRAVVIKRLMTVLAQLFFNYVLIGQFDRIYDLDLGLGSFRVTGEQTIYWVTAGLVGAAVMHLLLNVHETAPRHPPQPERFRPAAYVRETLATRQFVMIYVLMFASVAMNTGLAQLAPLLITEQFGYSKQALGGMATISIVLNLAVVIPLAAVITDRFDRFRIFQAGLVLSTLHPLAYWCFVKFLAPGEAPGVAVIIAFSLANTLFDSVANLALEPYFFDLVPRSKMGTINSGFLFVRGVLSVVITAGVGLWVKYYSQWFGAEGRYDYMSGYLYIFGIGVLGVVASLYFQRERRRGRVIEYGRLEEEGVDVDRLAAGGEGPPQGGAPPAARAGGGGS